MLLGGESPVLESLVESRLFSCLLSSVHTVRLSDRLRVVWHGILFRTSDGVSSWKVESACASKPVWVCQLYSETIFWVSPLSLLLLFFFVFKWIDDFRIDFDWLLIVQIYCCCWWTYSSAGSLSSVSRLTLPFSPYLQWRESERHLRSQAMFHIFNLRIN